jgi:hypothetical protein
VGIDVSTRHIAIACPRAKWARKVHRTVRGSPLTEAAELAGLARDALADRFGRLPGLFVFVEAPVLAGARNIQTTVRLAIVTGALGQALGGNARLVPVSSWKKAVVGHGNATKADVAEWLALHEEGLAALCGRDQDLVDATCVALYGAGVELAGPGSLSELGPRAFLPRAGRKPPEGSGVLPAVPGRVRVLDGGWQTVG